MTLATRSARISSPLRRRGEPEHRRDEPRRPPLFWRVFLPNAAVLLGAGILLALTPVTVSAPLAPVEAALLAAGLAAMLIVNGYLLRRTIRPIERLSALMSHVDPLRPGLRVSDHGSDREVADLAHTFNEMIDRLEQERRDSARRALGAQEGERRRIALELHDEIGQSLTAALLQIERAISDVGDRDAERRLQDAKEMTRASLEELRVIARRLRPEALDDFGLPSALQILCDEVFEPTDISVHLTVDDAMPQADMEVAAVIYRVAQESVTNVVRHAAASRAELSLAHDSDGLTLRVDDDGTGMPPEPEPGTGIRGMQERAVLVGGRFEIGRSPLGGTRVELHIPAGAFEDAAER